MEIPQVNVNTGIEKTIGVQPQENQEAPQATNTDQTAQSSQNDVVTISQEARNINTRVTETTNPAPAANNAETTRERDVSQIIQKNLDEEANTENETPERANPVNEIA
jgi:hypothetical protein